MLTKKTLENVHLLGEWLRLTFKGNKFDADEFNYEVLMFLGLGSHQSFEKYLQLCLKHKLIEEDGFGYYRSIAKPQRNSNEDKQAVNI